MVDVSAKEEVPGAITPNDVVSVLEHRILFQSAKLSQKRKRYEKFLAQLAKKQDRAVKLIPRIKSQEYKVKIAALLDEVTKYGITGLKNQSARGGWLVLSADLKGRAVSCHIWSDLRGPVLDVYRSDSLRSGKPLLRLKYYRKIHVENRVLDSLLEPVHKPELFF